ncbi:MAG: hypothetical protein L6275_04285 [Candidatus Portnoybacteria bacterium]|nr:hypothetical protein [Candidatus Portnoybacteria bacterium]
MEHLAIMKKSLGCLEKIISGEKVIETRWYNSRRSPWNKIKKGDFVYFQNSGSAVAVKSKVKKVIQYDDLNPNKIQGILSEFGKDIGIQDLKTFFKEIKSKRYCILIFLENIKEISPFFIDKTGFGLMSAWISIDSINQIRR